MYAPSASTGGRSQPSASLASSAATTLRPWTRGSRSTSSTRPPGKTWTSGANAIDAGRCVSSASRPSTPWRSRTTVAAGFGVVTRPSYARPAPIPARGCAEIVASHIDLVARSRAGPVATPRSRPRTHDRQASGLEMRRNRRIERRIRLRARGDGTVRERAGSAAGR